MNDASDAISLQAAAHFARRHAATTAQRDAREAWLRQDPRHAAAYDGVRQAWDLSAALADDPELQALKAADLAALPRRTRPPRRWLAMAASLALLVGAGVVGLRLSAPPDPVGYATTLGEKRTEAMADGTRVVLNTDTALEVRFSRSQRAVSLARGEAQFDVAHDPARPFVVSVGSDTVTALGTRFQVRRDVDATVITLLEGRVEVASGEQRHILQPNERAVLSPRTGIAIASIDPRMAEGWLEGWLRFRGTPLAEVIAEGNRYSTQKLRLGHPRLAAVPLSGNFHAGDNASIADAASLILPVRVERRGQDIVLLPE